MNEWNMGMWMGAGRAGWMDDQGGRGKEVSE